MYVSEKSQDEGKNHGGKTAVSRASVADAVEKANINELKMYSGARVDSVSIPAKNIVFFVISTPSLISAPPFFLDLPLLTCFLKDGKEKELFCHFFHILPKYHRETNFIQAKISDETSESAFDKLSGDSTKHD